VVVEEYLPSQIVHNRILIGLGANTDGAWGTPEETLERCIKELKRNGIDGIFLSPAYQTKAHGSVRQPDYVNLVARAACAATPRQLINLFKHIERRSGRRLLGRNGPRPLDIDLLDFAGRTINWTTGFPRPKLVLPHPMIALRPFVLAPLADLAPTWRHPVYGMTASQMLQALGGRRRFLLRREICRVDSATIPCE
jgi:2-amino-4-hydroxy-6-hydroxymethyldihydropteridine diphosphokinase